MGFVVVLETSPRIFFMNGKNKRYLKLAMKVAKYSDSPVYRHGAVLVKGGSVINLAANSQNTTSFGARFRHPDKGRATHHAEVASILGVPKSKTKGSILYVARINRKEEPMMSQPCPMCHDVLKHVGVKKVVYTAGAEEIGSYKL